MRIARAARLLHSGRGDVLYRHGDACDGLFVIGLGYAALSAVAEPDREKVIELRGPGESFGEEGILADAPRLLTARMLSSGLLVSVPRGAVLEVLDQQPGLAHGILDNLSCRTLDLMQSIESQTMRSCLERVVAFLMFRIHAGDDGPQEIHLPVQKHVIASLLNVTKESFSRALRELAEMGRIEVHGRAIRVPDPRTLEELCHRGHGCTHCWGCARGGR